MNESDLSPAQIIARLPPKIRDAELAKLPPAIRAQLRYHWPFHARPKQRAPAGDWLTWLILSGRGFGKTRTGAEWVKENVCGTTPLGRGKCGFVALIAETAGDAREVMIEGPSGLLAVHAPEFRPDYEPSKRRITWKNGAVAGVFNATEPDQLRGPEHDLAWGDELAKWAYARETWDNLQFGLRQGFPPRCAITTTPRPIPLLREIVADPSTVITKGGTTENSDNLAPSFLHRVVTKYGGTRLGRQELNAEILDDVPGALWTRDKLEENRVREHPNLLRLVIAIDPSGGSTEGHAEVGIVAAGKGADSHAYVLRDVSERLAPERWARRAVQLYHELKADRIVAEKNFGGDMVDYTIRTIDPEVPVRLVSASRGKQLRAEPVSALDEQGRIHHVGTFPTLEDQLCSWVPDSGDPSPDRLDARVWAITELMLGGAEVRFL